MLDDSTTSPVRLYARQLALTSCAILAGGLPLSEAQASASEGQRPVIDNAVATYITEDTTRLEARISPGGYETSYEFWLECQTAAPSGAACEPVVGGSHEQGGHIAAVYAEQTASVELSGLQPGYTYRYRVAATNIAGKTESPPLEFETAPFGTCHKECPYKTGVSLEAIEQATKFGAEAPAREAARQAAREQAEREAALAKAAQPGSASTSAPATTATGSVSLASTAITVQRGRVSQVKLECLGSASCHGKLTLLAKVASNVKHKKRTRTVTIGTASFSVPGDETKTVKIDLDATGRALLSARRGRLSASLTIIELAPNPDKTQTVTCISFSGRCLVRQRNSIDLVAIGFLA
jgi:hypothetical protein